MSGGRPRWRKVKNHPCVYRRVSGDGSDYTGPGQRYRIQVWVTDADGRRTHPVRFASSLDEADAVRDRLRQDSREGTFVPKTKLTVRQYAEQKWFPSLRSTLRESAAQWYTRNVERHVLPSLGNVKLQQVTPERLSRLYADLQTRAPGDGKLGVNSVRHVHTCVHRMLRDAVRWKYLSVNHADTADVPSATKTERPTWSAEELAHFLDATRSDREYTLWYLLAATGCRRGEVLGLRWRDLDLDAGRVSVTRSLSYVQPTEERPNGWKFEDTKTRRNRVISLDRDTVVVLKAHRRRQNAERLALADTWRGAAKRDDDLVFTAPSGEPVHPNTCSTWFEGAVRRAGVSRLTIHGLRHTHATLGLRAGIQPKVMQARLGHSSITVTMDIYSHVIPEQDADAAATIARLWSRHRKAGS